jgi:ACT domain-containing protein
MVDALATQPNANIALSTMTQNMPVKKAAAVSLLFTSVSVEFSLLD